MDKAKVDAKADADKAKADADKAIANLTVYLSLFRSKMSLLSSYSKNRRQRGSKNEAEEHPLPSDKLRRTKKTLIAIKMK